MEGYQLWPLRLVKYEDSIPTSVLIQLTELCNTVTTKPSTKDGGWMPDPQHHCAESNYLQQNQQQTCFRCDLYYKVLAELGLVSVESVVRRYETNATVR